MVQFFKFRVERVFFYQDYGEIIQTIQGYDIISLLYSNVKALLYIL
ncbi:hypothetical protein pb186bvf_019936 [Paramecium bursaria]